MKYHRARGTFITEHPCLEEVQLSKGGAPRNCECHVRMKCLSGRDNPLYLPLMQTRAQVAKNWEVKNSLGLKVTSGNTVLNFWIKNDNVKRLKLLPLLLTAFCDNHNTYSMQKMLFKEKSLLKNYFSSCPTETIIKIPPITFFLRHKHLNYQVYN